MTELEHMADAISMSFISGPAEAAIGDTRNVTDGLFAIARALYQVADRLDRIGGEVGALYDAIARGRGV